MRCVLFWRASSPLHQQRCSVCARSAPHLAQKAAIDHPHPLARQYMQGHTSADPLPFVAEPYRSLPQPTAAAAESSPALPRRQLHLRASPFPLAQRRRPLPPPATLPPPPLRSRPPHRLHHPPHHQLRPRRRAVRPPRGSQRLPGGAGRPRGAAPRGAGERPAGGAQQHG